MEKSYGQRELLVLAPDGNLIAFEQEIKNVRQHEIGRRLQKEPAGLITAGREITQSRV
jgi:hypothetical protein